MLILQFAMLFLAYIDNCCYSPPIKGRGQEWGLKFRDKEHKRGDFLPKRGAL